MNRATEKIFGLFLAAILVLVPPVPARARVVSCAAVFGQTAGVSRALKYNLFTINRRLDRTIRSGRDAGSGGDYVSFLGQEFRLVLEGLTPDKHWIDMGSGDAEAMLDLVWLKGGDSPKLTAIGYVEPRFGLLRRKVSAKFARLNAKFRYVSGVLAENLPANSIERAQVISDVYGPLHYSVDMIATLEKYLELLSDDGVIYTNSLNGAAYIKTTGGVTQDFVSWLSRHGTGFTIERPQGIAGPVVIRKNGAPLRLPRLKLVSDSPESPPVRVFEPVSE